MRHYRTSFPTNYLVFRRRRTTVRTVNTNRGIETQDSEDLTCTICGVEPEPDQKKLCEVCQTLHHQDCWNYNKGCARYACSAGPHWQADRRNDDGTLETEDGKILISHLSVGSYDGIYYAPPIACVLTILFEFVMLLAPLMGFGQWGVIGGIGMVLSILWISISSERYYLDLDNRAITKSKALFGRDILEWTVMPLAQVSRLSLVPVYENETAYGPEDRVPDRFLLAAIDRNEEGFALAPSVETGGETFRAYLLLLSKLRANNAFPVEVPTTAQIGADQSVLENLNTPLLEDE